MASPAVSGPRPVLRALSVGTPASPAPRPVAVAPSPASASVEAVDPAASYAATAGEATSVLWLVVEAGCAIIAVTMAVLLFLKLG